MRSRSHAVRRALCGVAAVGLAGVATAAAATAAGAQDPTTVPDTTRPPARRPVRCSGQRVSDVIVLSQPPYMNALLGRFAWVERTVRQLHATTQPELIEGFMLIRPGDRCDELRRAESERILRAQPYLVDARVTPYADGRGGVLLEVETRDEFSAIVELAARASTPFVTTVRIGEANLAGRGLYTSMAWSHGGPGYRDGFAGRLTDYQFMGQPYQLTLQGAQEHVGKNFNIDLTHPFYTDLQRVAWRMSAGGRDEFLELQRPIAVDNALMYRRRYSAIGGMARIGAPGRLSLFGLSLSAERAETDNHVVVLSDTGQTPDFGPPIGFVPNARYPAQQVVRLNSLWGIRNVRFLGAVGFDALTGRQDVRRGFQLGTVVGRGMGALGSRDDDIFTSADAYAGMGTSRLFTAAEVLAEGGHDYDRNRWDGIVTSGRAALYAVPNDRWRTHAELEYSGTWRPRVPVQLRLGEFDGGVRGFHGATAAGAQRVVARLEERLVVGSPYRLGDVGVAAWVDAGRTYAGDAPYGVNSGTQAAVGVGLLGAFPPRSRRMWRVDLAFPVTKTPGAGFQLLLSNRDLTRTFWREPKDIQRAREQAIPPTLFSWP